MTDLQRSLMARFEPDDSGFSMDFKGRSGTVRYERDGRAKAKLFGRDAPNDSFSSDSLGAAILFDAFEVHQGGSFGGDGRPLLTCAGDSKWHAHEPYGARLRECAAQAGQSTTHGFSTARRSKDPLVNDLLRDAEPGAQRFFGWPLEGFALFFGQRMRDELAQELRPGRVRLAAAVAREIRMFEM